MLASLYTISNNLKSLLDDIASQDGEITEEQSNELKISHEELEQKCSSYLWIIKAMKAENNLIDAEIERLEKLKKRNDTTVLKLEDNLLQAVQSFGTDGKLKYPTFTLSTRKSESTEITDLEKLPTEFVKINLNLKDIPDDDSKNLMAVLNKKGIQYDLKINPDKILIKNTIKEGKEVAGAELKTNIKVKY